MTISEPDRDPPREAGAEVDEFLDEPVLADDDATEQPDLPARD